MDNRLQPSLDSGNGDVRVKQLFGGALTLRDYDGQVAEAMALVRALNKMTKAGMPESVRIA
ncbi:transposase [Klebsiella pneumoniae]|nr:transposase [Klebsiella pneumoniae]